MRFDIVSIFPEYLAPLSLSLLGKAQDDGVVSIDVHNLRDFATDARRTVDDTPYGGGAGMVMTPEPWAAALEHVMAHRPESSERPVLIVPTPAGRLFKQRTARELAARDHITFACGRYEGIDERVSEWASQHFDVMPLSLGDYVLNGGEIAAMAMTEAIARLVPGFMGNPESLVEESHESGLVEYPSYTKPATWRGLDVPEVLRGGDHRAITDWRQEKSRERTAQRRPDLLPPVTAGDVVVRQAEPADHAQIATLLGLSDLLAGGYWEVAVEGNRIVGALCSLTTEDSIVIGTAEVIVDRRELGIARLLVQHAGRRAAAQSKKLVAAADVARADFVKWARKRGVKRIAPPDSAGVAHFDLTSWATGE